MCEPNGVGAGQAPEMISASCPGGMARQYRVQIESAETLSHWELAGCFADAEAARQFAVSLRQSGQHTRIIACRALPTAA
jgi:hypothetical protein